MKIYAFELYVSNTDLPFGRSVKDNNIHIKFRSFTNKDAEELNLREGNYFYTLDNKENVKINVRVVKSREKQMLFRRSKGFASHDWMIDSILEHKEIIATEKNELNRVFPIADYKRILKKKAYRK